ncbi:MAG: patatin-like phospholipase family protein [Legionella sp.]|nr:patatin-like phospholipase family protein [Legionella sp.]
MTPQHVISQLLESDTKYPKNLDLLKKIMIVAYLGRLQINGLPADNKISLASYLFDNERVMFDFTRLSDIKKELFTKWFLEPHKNDRTRAHFSNATVNEYRGFTAEVFLSPWGQFKNWLYKRHTDYWKVTDLNLSLHYQLVGVEMCYGKNGILIGFDQFLAPTTGNKYHDPNDIQTEPLGNTKRVFITDQLVNLLLNADINHIPFECMCKLPHPQSIEVSNKQERFNQMSDYRKTHKIFALQAWYIRLWNWLFSWLREARNHNQKRQVTGNVLVPIYQNETVQIEQFSKTHELLVKELRPDIDNIVYCGGGAKIFGHVGFWKALNEANIHPAKFAGSSAGAIMALLCYLGYNAQEITELFKNFRQENIIHFDISINGLSEAHSLKTALDFAIARKLKHIVTQYNIPYPEGKITFATLNLIREQCPGCGLGEELVVTATNKRLGKTRYFSLQRSPLFEVSEAVKISASLPIVYRPTLLNGDEYNDGGVLTNFPTEAFFDDHSTLLESEYGNNLKVLAVQFDNGTERTTIDRMMEKVYKENFFVNWMYRVITGVNDPASGWNEDREKLRKHSAQSIVINVDKVSSTSFSVDEKSRDKMIQAGYETTNSYLTTRYTIKDGVYKNDELMYTKFSSLGDLLSYCCYRGDRQWFDVARDLIGRSNVPNKLELNKQAEELYALYFNLPDSALNQEQVEDNPLTFFGNAVPQEPKTVIGTENHKILLAVYPIFLKLVPELLKDSVDKKIFECARHSFTLHSPFICLEHFAKISNPVNIVLHVLIKLMTELNHNPCNKAYEDLQQVLLLLNSNINIYKEDYYDTWSLSVDQCLRVLQALNTRQERAIYVLLKSLSQNEEPLQVVFADKYHEDSSEFYDEEGLFNISLC